MENIRRFAHMFRSIGICTFLILGSWSTLAEVDLGSELKPKLSRIALKQALEEYAAQEVAVSTPGYALGVIVDGETFIISTGGFREQGGRAPINADTVFRLASVSKTFTSGLAASLPTIDWGMKLNDFLPGINLSRADYQQELSLRHLLSQTSGLLPHAYTNLIQDNVPYKKIVHKLDRVDFVCAPGRCYGYQNVIYSLAGDLIAAAEGASYESLVQKHLFNPLGMKDSSFGLQDFKAAENRATPHEWDKLNQQWKPVTVRENYYRLAPAAGVNASLNDMMRWLRVQLGQHPEVIAQPALNNMHTPQIRTTRKLAHYGPKAWNGVENTQYALGWRTFDFKGEVGFVHHGGWVKGVRTEMAFNPRLNMGLIYLSNSESGYASRVVPRVLRLYLAHGSANTSKIGLLDGQ